MPSSKPFSYYRKRLFARASIGFLDERGRVVCRAVACHWCDRWLSYDLMTVDHVEPLVEGGARTAADNHVPACQPCNAARSTAWCRSPVGLAWRRHRQALKGAPLAMIRALFANDVLPRLRREGVSNGLEVYIPRENDAMAP